MPSFVLPNPKQSFLDLPKTMVQSDFKNINVVPIGNEFVDHILSRVHRQTPKVRRKGFNINHLRQCYTLKVKKTELTFCDKLSTVVDEFPRFDEIHPLYIDILRFVFDRDHYKLSLDQVNTARHMITNISNDYVTQLEFAESSKQCKSLKVSAIGRMFSVIEEITPSLAYLEQIRQHMVRLPSIDPNAPTLFVCGYPNVDKTYFISRVINTGAGHDDFTTKSVVFVVGHTDYRDLRYQVIDAPGVLDRPTFGDCNVMAALARHLSAGLVLFFMDVSGSCGYSIAHQAALLHSLKSLFVNKPLVVVCDETDLMQLSQQDWELIEETTGGMCGNEEEEEEEVVLKISNLRTEEGLMSVKNAACEKILDRRERQSCVAKARREWKDDTITQTDLDDDHNVSADVLFKVKESEREEGPKKGHEDEEDDFVMAEEHFREENKDQLVASRKIPPLRILIAFVVFSSCRGYLWSHSRMSISFKLMSLFGLFWFFHFGILIPISHFFVHCD